MVNEKIRVINNKEKRKCGICGKDIVGYKLRVSVDSKRASYYHLKCYYDFCLRSLNNLKGKISVYKKAVKKINRYKKQLIADSLQ